MGKWIAYYKQQFRLWLEAHPLPIRLGGSPHPLLKQKKSVDKPKGKPIGKIIETPRGFIAMYDFGRGEWKYLDEDGTHTWTRDSQALSYCTVKTKKDAETLIRLRKNWEEAKKDVKNASQTKEMLVY